MSYMSNYPTTINKKTVFAVLAVAAILVAFPGLSRLYADIGYGGESQIQSFFDGTTGFLVKTLGTGVFILGLVVAGIKITTGDQGGLRTAVMVMVGGAIIFLSQPIVSIFAKFTGTR